MEESGAEMHQERHQEKEMEFIGEYNHTVDAKGRVIVPSRFRDKLGDEFIVTKGLDDCLYVYENSEWEKFAEKLSNLSIANRDSRKITRFFLSGATTCEVDKQGRILLPAVLREFAALDKDVVLVGVGARIEIWSSQRWSEAAEYDDMDDIAEHMSELGLMI